MFLLKKLGRCVLAFLGFTYDWVRFLKYNGWRKDNENDEFRGYYVTKLAHTLEKSMSYKEQRTDAGYANGRLLVDVLSKNRKNGEFSDLIAVKTLRFFVDGKSERFTSLAQEVDQYPEIDEACGAKKFNDLNSISLPSESPESFFLSRSSLREYSDELVDIDTVYRVIKLANKTPSSCNMQPWHTYVLSDPAAIETALKFQTGNNGFGHGVKNLLIVAADQSAFISSSERYQHWIDGGMYAMSLIYAMHSIGIGACCLNWSEDPKKDLLLRSALGIRGSHSIIMMISFGWPEIDSNVCVSPRVPYKSKVTVI